MKLADALRNTYDTVYILKYVDGRFRYDYISVKADETTYLTKQSVGKFMDDVIPRYRSERMHSLFLKALGENIAVEYSEKINATDYERIISVPIETNNVSYKLLLVYSEHMKVGNEATFEMKTGLPSFNYFREFVQQKLENQQQQNKSLALLYVNIDKFNNIIDKIGHARIEHIITQIATRMNSILDNQSILARITGDELIISIEDSERAPRLARDVQNSLVEPFIVNSLEIFVTASIGISALTEKTETVDRLIMQAYRAMFEAKQLGGNRIERYSDCKSRPNGELDSHMLERELNKAIENQEFTVYYQPIIHLHTQRIHFEALIRWFSPKLGFIAPDQFILVAEACGIIEMIDEWVIDKVCQQVGSCLDKHFHVSVNLSTKTLESQRLEATLLNTTKRHGVNPSRIVLEITEHSILQNEAATIDKLKRLRSAGFQIAIDDFGVSHASLNYLRVLPVDKIKIDKVFIQNIMSGSKDYHIVTSIISLAQKLGLVVTAEGVETEEQLELLTRMNCDEIQGFYFSKPVPHDTIEGVTKSLKKELFTLLH